MDIRIVSLLVLLELLVPGRVLASLPPPPDGSMRVALIQYDADAHFTQTAENLATLTQMALTAIGNGATLIQLPEGAVHGYANKDSLWCRPGTATCGNKKCLDVNQVAEPVPGGPVGAYWEAFAQLFGVTVLYNLPEVDGDTYYNTTAVASPEGFQGKYRKRSLYYVDQCYAVPGSQPLVFDTDHARFGVLTCLDGADIPKTYYEELRSLGADAVLIAMDWDEDPHGPGQASKLFRIWAERYRFDLYTSDMSPWDGTGKYFSTGLPRERNGLADPAIGIDGISYHDVAYR
jgi:predicted amidohydrolase